MNSLLRQRTRFRTRGFTLAEVLIVMALLVALSALLAPILIPSATRELRAAASEVATTLRETRRVAQAQQARQRFLMNTDTGEYGILNTRTQRKLPEEMHVQMTTAQSLLTSQESGGIDFFPDGSSTGGRVMLHMKDRSMQVDIEWLTGRIRVSEADTP